MGIWQKQKVIATVHNIIVCRLFLIKFFVQNERFISSYDTFGSIPLFIFPLFSRITFIEGSSFGSPAFGRKTTSQLRGFRDIPLSSGDEYLLFIMRRFLMIPTYTKVKISVGANRIRLINVDRQITDIDEVRSMQQQQMISPLLLKLPYFVQKTIGLERTIDTSQTHPITHRVNFLVENRLTLISNVKNLIITP